MRFGSRRACAELILLAPPSSIHYATIGFSQTDPVQYKFLIEEVQRLRASIYLRDGAVDPKLISSDGRLIHSHDERGWQLVIRNFDGSVVGCARYIPHEDGVSFSNLGVARSALASCSSWGTPLRRAIEAQRMNARRRGITFAEVGGWAIADELRYSSAALDIFINVCALAKISGGAIAITTATFRHHSSSILKRLGGNKLVNDTGEEFPSYFDPQHNCEMEILQFDTECANARYADRIDSCQANLANVPTLDATSLTSECAVS